METTTENQKNTLEESVERFKRLSKRYKAYRDTKGLIFTISGKIAQKLGDAPEKEDPEIGLLLGIHYALCRLKQFEDIINKPKDGEDEH